MPITTRNATAPGFDGWLAIDLQCHVDDAARAIRGPSHARLDSRSVSALRVLSRSASADNYWAPLLTYGAVP